MLTAFLLACPLRRSAHSQEHRHLGLSPGRPAVHAPGQPGEQEGNDRMVTLVLLCPVSLAFGFPFL